MNARTLIDGDGAGRLAPDDRGLLYGDGLFETILFVRGAAPFWRRHMQRLQRGCSRLSLSCPDASSLADEAARASEGMSRAVVRITITRGIGARGYAPPRDPLCTRVVAAFDAPPVAPDWYTRGIRVRFADLQLSSQPRLAGIKHLNRLEQVLARAEWTDPDIVEALMFDTEDHVICATAANVFLARDGRLVTPMLDRCGVEGVARAEILDAFPETDVRRVVREELAGADEVFLCSSVRGILPVRELAGRTFEAGPITRTLQARWRKLGMAPEGVE